MLPTTAALQRKQREFVEHKGVQYETIISSVLDKPILRPVLKPNDRASDGGSWAESGDDTWRKACHAIIDVHNAIMSISPGGVLSVNGTQIDHTKFNKAVELAQLAVAPAKPLPEHVIGDALSVAPAIDAHTMYRVLEAIARCEIDNALHSAREAKDRIYDAVKALL